MKHEQKNILILLVIFLHILLYSCKSTGIGGAGWDDEINVEDAKKFPPIESNRVKVTLETVSYQTFKQEFDNVFEDFPYKGLPVRSSSTESHKTEISGTSYSISYENFVLMVYKDDKTISERVLPKVFYMHPMSSGIILGNSQSEDRIVCRTNSRSTSGLHYILILDGNGEILYEKVVSAADDWDILPGGSGDIIIGGARTKTVISNK